MNAVKNYFRNSIKEFNNVTWPTKQQAIKISVIVLIFMLISAAILALVDYGLSVGFKSLLSISFL